MTDAGLNYFFIFLIVSFISFTRLETRQKQTKTKQHEAAPYWQVEPSVLHGLNVISAVIVSGNSRYGIIGAYILAAYYYLDAHQNSTSLFSTSESDSSGESQS